MCDVEGGGLVVSALDFLSAGRSFEPSLCRRAVSLDKKLYFPLSLLAQVYEWSPAIIMLGGRGGGEPCGGLTSHPGE